MKKFIPKQKQIYSFFKYVFLFGVILSLVLQSVAAFALEIQPISNQSITENPDWGDLTQFNRIGDSYSDQIVEKIRQINNQPELLIDNQNLTAGEKTKIAQEVNQASEKVLFKNIDDLDTKFENSEFFGNLNQADEEVIDSLKQANVIETYIDPDTGLETVVDPNLVEDNGTLKTKATPANIILPTNPRTDEINLSFDGIETDNQIAKSVAYSVVFDPVNANQSQAEIDNNIAVYKNQWDNVDVVLTTQPNGVKEDIILKSKQSRQITRKNSGYHGDNNWIFYYKLDLANVYPRANNGQIEFINSQGSVVATITNPFLIDNNGEISQNAYYQLLTAEEYNDGYEIDTERFDLSKKIRSEESDLSNPFEAQPESDQTLPTENDITPATSPESSVQSVPANDFWANFWESIKTFFEATVQLVAPTAAQTEDGPSEEPNDGGLIDQIIDEIGDVLPDITIDPSGYSEELDQTLPPIEQIGLEDLIKEESTEKVTHKDFEYLALVVNTINLQYPIDIDPTTYILTGTDLINTANGQLLSNEINDVKLYDATLEPTSNYAYNKELKSTLGINNSIGAFNPDNLLALYAFDENDLSSVVEDDVTVSAVNGSRQGDPLYRSGQINSALEFFGSDEYVNFTDNDKFTFTDDFSFSAWINPDNFSNRNPILSKGTASNWEYNLEVTTDAAIEFTARALNGTQLYQVSTPNNVVKPNQWNHVALTRDDSEDNLSIYINNVLLANDNSANGQMTNGSADFQIARTAHTSAAFFDGKIDDVRLFSDVLTQSEVLNLYENGKSKLVGWWNMTDTSDYAGYLNHGSAIGTTINNNGKVNSSRIFTTSDLINLGNNYSLSPGQNLTVEVWVNTDSNGTVISKQDEYSLAICQDGRPMFSIYTNGQWQNNLGTTDQCSGGTYQTVNDNNWHHLAGSYDGDYIRLFIDGKQVAHYYFAGSVNRTSNDAIISSDSFVGELDEIAIYNRALSGDELFSHYNHSYSTRVANILNFDNSIDFTEYAQLAFDNLIVTVPGVLQIKGLDKDGNEISEKIKFRAGEITRQLSSNHYRNITELNALNYNGDSVGAKLQIAQGSLKSFSPFHDANWRYGISKADDRVTGIWHFDEGAGSVAFDSSRTNNDAFLAGGQSGSWLFSREIDMTPATPIDNFQVQLTLTPETFDYSNAQEDGGDLRFFDSNQVEQPYWIANWDNTGESEIWIKVISSGTTSITMKYGNPSAADGSDGQATMELADNFNGSTIDTSIWGDNFTGFSVNNGLLTGTTTTGRLLSNLALSGNYVLETRHYSTDDAANGYTLGGFWESSANGLSFLAYNNTNYYLRDDGSWLGAYNFTWINNWVRLKIVANGANSTVQLYRESDGAYSTLHTVDNSPGVSNEKVIIGQRADGNPGQVYNGQWDWIFVRKYNAIEPILTIGGIQLDNIESYTGQTPWYNTSWSYRAPIYIDNTQNPYDLTDYQLLVGIDTSDLVPGQMLANFNDVRFTEDDQTTPVDHYYDSTNSTSSNTHFWVEVPNIPAKSIATIYIYYGNASASNVSSFDNTLTKTFSESDLRGLWHLDTGSGTTVTDSSGNGHTGTFNGSPTWQGSDGGFWGLDIAQSFSTGDHLFFNNSPYVSVPHDSDFDFEYNDSFSISTWMKGVGATSDDFLIAKALNSGNYTGYYLSIANTSGYVYFTLQNSGSYYNQIRTNSGITDTNWHHVVVTYNGNGQSSGIKIYIDNVEQATTSINSNLGGRTIRNTVSLNFGSRDSGGIPYHGYLDEIRITARELGAEEISRQYARSKYSPVAPVVTTSSSAPDTNIPTWTDNGKYDQALSFDGSNDYVVIPDEDSLDAKEQLTIGAWVNPGALDGWLYNRSLTISPPTGLDNTQLKLTLNTGNFDYLKAENDGSDIRFAATDGSLIDYWIENWDPLGESIVWVKVPQAGTSKIYMYYGSAGTTDSSNFDNTFTKESSDDNLIAQWHMDEGSDNTCSGGEDLCDSSGNGLHATHSGAVNWVGSDGGQWDSISNTQFSSGDSVTLNGSSEYATSANYNQTANQSFTAMAWIYPTSTMSNSNGIVSRGQSGSGQWSLFGGAPGNNNKIGFWTSNPSESLYNPNEVTLNQWHHVAAVYDGSKKLFVDGELVATDASAGFNTFNIPFTIGKWDYNTANWYFPGDIDEAKVYSRALSEEEIVANYERRLYTSSTIELAAGSQEAGSPSTVSERTITFSPATPYINYIAKINLTTSNFDYTKTRLDGGDIRFYDTSGNSLSYYIYNWDTAGTSTVYVKIPTSGTGQIKMQYGEKDVYSLSDGNNALTIHDNFDDGQFDSSKWSRINDDPLAWNEGADIPGWFKLKALNSKNMSGDTATAPIILSQENMAASDYDVYTTVRFDPSLPSANGQQTGIIIYQDDNNYIEAGIGYNGGDKAIFKIESDNEPVSFEEDMTTTTYVDLRVNKSGDNFKFFYKDHSTSDWIEHGTIINKNLGVEKVGFISYADTAADLVVYYDNFSIIKTHTTQSTATIGLAESWSYKRGVSISPSTADDDMQIPIILDNTFTYGNLQSAGQDLRFFDVNFNKLNYWIQYWNDASYGNYSKVWVDIPNSGTEQIYMYYGNSNVSAESNGYNTFSFFDDFSGTTINTAKWVEFDNGNYLSQNDKIITTGGNSTWGSNGLTSVKTFNRDNLALHFEYKPTATNDAMFGWHDSGTGTNYTDLIYAYYNAGTTTVDVYEDGNNRAPSTSGSWNNGTTYMVKMSMKEDAGAIYERSTDGGINYEENYDSIYSTESPVKIGITNYNKAFEIDNLFITKESLSQPIATLDTEDSWFYKKTIDLEKNGAPITTPTDEYQVKVTITPADINYSHVNDDGSDLRFFDDDGNQLNYWIERWANGGTSTVWVKIPNSGTGSFTMFYGNASAGSASNAEATFDFYDDFEDGELDTGKWSWTRAVTGAWDEGQSREGMLMIAALNDSNMWETDNSAPVLATNTDFSSQDYEVSVRLQASLTEDYQQGGLIVYEDDSNHVQGNRGYNSGQKVTFKKEDTATATASDANQSDTDVDLRLRKVGSTFRFFYKKHSDSTWNEFSSGAELDLTMTNEYLGLSSYSDNGADVNIYFDDFRVNKIDEIDPDDDIVATFASEQSKDADLSETTNLITKGSAFSLGASENDIYATIGSQSIDSPLVDGWNHVVMTYDGQNQSLYINGDLVVSESYSADIGVNNDNIIVGNKFYGYIDDVVISKRAMSARQIFDWYNNDQDFAKNQPVETQDESINTEILTDNLIGHWKFNEGAGTVTSDSSTSGYDGTLTNGPNWVSGKDGFGLNFDGSNDFVTMGNQTAYQFEYNQPFSISGWIKTDTNLDRIILGKNENGGNYRGYYWFVNGAAEGYLAGEIRSTATYRIYFEGSTVINDNQWHHLVMTYDGSGVGAGVKLYIDGVQDNILLNVDNLQSNTIIDDAPLTIGARETGNSPLPGRVDDVRVYNDILTAGEANSLAHQHDYRFTDDLNISQASGINISGQQYVAASQLAIKINSSGAVGNASYNVSNDGGLSWSSASYAASNEISNLIIDGTDTGVDIQFDLGYIFNKGDVYNIASWYTEPKSNTRGIRRSFPEVAGIIATDNSSNPFAKSIDIIDTNDNSLWMRFTNSNDDDFLGGGNTSITGLDMAYGQMYAASSDQNNDSIGLLKVNYLNDSARLFRNTSQAEIIDGNITQRNSGNVIYNDDTMVLGDIKVNDVDVAMLAGRIVAVAATTGTQGGIAVIDEANNNVIYGSSGGDDINKLKLSDNGNLYLSNETDSNVISIDNILSYTQNFNFNNRNETFANTASATYQIASGSTSDIVLDESQSIADEFSSDEIYIAGSAGVGLIDTVTSPVSDDTNIDDLSGFSKIITNEYITESMNGIGKIKGMWIAGDQTSTAMISDRSIEANDMSVNGFSSNSLSSSDWDTGVRGPALVFTGDDYLSLSDNSGFDFSTDDTVSFGAWVNPATSQTQTIFGQTDNFALTTSNSGGQIIYEALINKNSTDYAVMSNEYDLTDAWHYVVGVHDGINDILKLYVDGELEADATTPADYTINNPSTAVTIGANSAGGSQFDGKISGVFISSTDLTHNQVKRLYNIGTGAKADNSDELNQIGGSSNLITALAIDRNNRKLYIGSTDGLTELSLGSDVQTNYWSTTTTPALPTNAVTSLDYANNKTLVATNSGALLIKTDGSYTNSASVGQVLSGMGNDVHTDGAYNYYVSDNGLDVINLVEQTRLGYVLNDYGFDSVASVNNYVYMANETGVYSLNVATMSGETTVTYPTYHVSSSIPIASDNVYDIHAREINNKEYLAVGTDNGLTLIGDISGDPYRILFYKNEGDDITKVWINEVGDLAYFNATDETINIVDNAIDETLYPFQTGVNSFDRQYSVNSTPAYIGSQVNDLVYVANTSTAQTNYDTLYIATNNGASVIQEHSTQSSGTVEHYVNQRLHDERTGLMLDFDNNYTPANQHTASYDNSVNQYDPIRQKYDYLHDPNLVGYWDFDQTAPAKIVDRSGHGNDGGFGPTTGTQGGKVGQALYLDGNNSYLIIDEDKSLHPTSAFSWAGWVWKDGAISNDALGQPILASKYDNGNNGEFVIYFNKSNKLQLKVSNGNTNFTVSESSAIGTEAWHHLAVTFNSGVVRYYIDGVLDSEYTTAVTSLALPPYNNIPGSMSDLYLGNDWSVFNNAFGGYMDEVAYYTDELTPEEVQSLYSLPEFTNSITVDNYDTLAYRTSANLTTTSGAEETFYLSFDETLSSNQGETFDLAIESELQRPDLDLISYGGNTNNNIILDLGTSGDWDDAHVWSPYVIKDGNQYLMWYNGNDGSNNRIGLATSSDGLNWTKYAGNNCSGTTGNGCVFNLGSGFDTNWVYAPSVIKDGNTYRMWYGGRDGSNIEIGYATSSDGINWTRQNGGNAVLSQGAAGSWDDVDVSYPRVIKEGTIYKMWYGGAQSAGNWRVGYATSSDGINWTKYDDNSVAECGFSETNDAGCLIDLGDTGAIDENDLENTMVVQTNGLYYLTYTAADSGGNEKAALMTSTNGIDWTRVNDANTILDWGTGGTWDDAGTNTPAIVSGNENIYYYSGYDGTNLRIGLATLDFESGRYGKSLRVEDNDIYTYDITNNFNRNQGTISFWAKLDNTTNSLHEAFNLQSSTDSDQDGLYMALMNNQVVAGYNGEFKLGSAPTLTNDYWHHFVLTWEKPSATNQNLKLYVDGELQESVLFDSAISADFDQLQIGGNQGETRDYLDGNIDELRVYNQALSSEDIVEIYNGSWGDSAKINTVSDPAEGTIEFLYTPDWDSVSDNHARTLFDTLGGDPLRSAKQYNDSKTEVNRFRIWKEEGPTLDDNDRLHFGILDNDGDLYEVYTNEDINWTQDTTYKITAEWDLDNNDAAGGGANVMRILVDGTLMAGDNFDTGDTDNKKKNGTDTDINEEITIDHISELMWIGSGMPNSQVNQVNNPSFEENNSGIPADWNTTGIITYDTGGTNSRFGTDAVSITGPRGTNRLQQTIHIIPGTWTLSWYAKGTASDSTQDIDVQISAGSLTGTTGDNTDPGTNYKYHNFTFSNDTAGDLTITLSANTGETVFFDGLTMVKGQLDENYQSTSSSYSDLSISNYVKDKSVLDAQYLARTYDSSNKNASLAGETNNASAVAVKKISTNVDASDDIIFVGTLGETNEGAVTQITFGSPDQRTNEYRQDTSGNSLTSNRINAISYSLIRNNLAIATAEAGVFGFFDDVPAQVTLSAPNGAEEWEGGSSQDISWSVDVGVCDHIDLYYSTNGGSSYEDIALNLDGVTTYNWDPVVELNSNSVITKVSCKDPFGAEMAYDTSDANFIIDSTSPSFSLYNIPNPSGDNIIYGRGAGNDTGGATSITEVQYKVDSNDWEPAVITSGTGTTSVEFDFSTTALDAGSHTIYVKGKDSSLPGGNEADLSTAASRTFNVDALSISFDKDTFDMNLSVTGSTSMTDSVDVTVTGYGTDYSLAIKADQPPTNRYYPTANIPFYTGNDAWTGATVGFGWRCDEYNSNNYNDFETGSYEVFKNSFASLLGDTTTVEFKAAIDWTVAAGDYDATVSIVVIPRY